MILHGDLVQDVAFSQPRGVDTCEGRVRRIRLCSRTSDTTHTVAKGKFYHDEYTATTCVIDLWPVPVPVPLAHKCAVETASGTSRESGSMPPVGPSNL